MRPKMTGKAGQAGFSLLGIVLAVTITFIITLFVITMATDKEIWANDAIARMTVSQVRLGASQCWNLYSHDGAQVSSDGKGIECTNSSFSTGRIVATLPEGVRVSLLTHTSGNSIEQLGAYHIKGSESSSSERTAFCLNADGSISTAENLADCPIIPEGSVQ